MRKRDDILRLLVVLAAVMILTVPTVSRGQTGETMALSTLRDQDRRVLTVGWRMSEAAADLCAPIARPGLGWSLHALGQYRAGLQPAAEQVFGLEHGRLGVLALAPDGPAAQAGIRENDLILAIGGESLDLGDESRADGRGDFAAVERALARIGRALTATPVIIRLSRLGRPMTVVVQPRHHCPWSIEVEPSQDFAASADGHRISITSRLATFARRDEDLAFLLGHEMAHNLRRPEETGARARSTPRELEADRIGLILAARANYATANVPQFVEELSRVAGPLAPLIRLLPGAVSRVAALRRTQDWIENQRDAGSPLTP